MKKILIIVLALTMAFVSCESRAHRVKMTTGVSQYVKNLSGSTYLMTKVMINGQSISLKCDDITKLSTDSIYTVTEARYNDANELMFKLKELKK